MDPKRETFCMYLDLVFVIALIAVAAFGIMRMRPATYGVMYEASITQEEE